MQGNGLGAEEGGAGDQRGSTEFSLVLNDLHLTNGHKLLKNIERSTAGNGHMTAVIVQL